MTTKPKIILTAFFFFVLLGTGFWVFSSQGRTPSYSEIEPGFEEILPEPPLSEYEQMLKDLENWKRPEGPLKVALQAGHWKAAEAPEEFPNLRANTGTSGGGRAEWQVNLTIAEETKKILEKLYPQIVVEILPATIPPDYYADVFVAIHADGNLNTGVRGYKVAAPRRDLTGKAQEFSKILEQEYGQATNLLLDPNITRNMTGYYAFNWRRYEHSLHPKTVGVILETGFLTNAGDRRVIVNSPQKSAQGIVQAVARFLGL